MFTQIEYINDTRYQAYYLWQKDYNVYEADSYEVGGVTLYYPVSGDQIGYEAFPAAAGEVNVELRGESIQDGFKR